MSTSWLGGHRARVADFQVGEERFVWGRVRDSEELWFLADNQAGLQRAHVRANIVCPVPGCAAPLTTVHSSVKRDHLRHLRSAGGHSVESVLHSQGCALIESWLRVRYPNATVSREEYTNERGERRADVLLTAADGARVAFEIQYSPISPDAWRLRHNSYRSQGIVDVWLFGHGSKQLRVNRDGLLLPNPTHEAVVRSGSALMFINPAPELEEIAFAVGTDFDADPLTGGRGAPVSVVSNIDRAQLEIRKLEDYRAHRGYGLVCDRLIELYATSHALPLQRREARLAAQERTRRIRRDAARARSQRQERVRLIRRLLKQADRWEASLALESIQDYFGPELSKLRRRIDVVEDGLVRWQCIIYFNFVAGRSEPFQTTAVLRLLQRHNVAVDPQAAPRQTRHFLRRLEEQGHLRMEHDYHGRLTFIPTPTGAWT